MEPILQVGLFLVLALICGRQASAQGGNAGRFGTLGGVEPVGQYPSQQYYLALQVYRSGDLEQAVELFERVQTRQDINGGWIDSIPVLAMRAECYWHLGHMPEVHASLDEVFQIAIRYRGWLGRVDWASAMQPGVQRAPNRDFGRQQQRSSDCRSRTEYRWGRADSSRRKRFSVVARSKN